MNSNKIEEIYVIPDIAFLIGRYLSISTIYRLGMINSSYRTLFTNIVLWKERWDNQLLPLTQVGFNKGLTSRIHHDGVFSSQNTATGMLYCASMINNEVGNLYYKDQLLIRDVIDYSVYDNPHSNESNILVIKSNGTMGNLVYDILQGTKREFSFTAREEQHKIIIPYARGLNLNLDFDGNLWQNNTKIFEGVQNVLFERSHFYIHRYNGDVLKYDGKKSILFGNNIVKIEYGHAYFKNWSIAICLTHGDESVCDRINDATGSLYPGIVSIREEIRLKVDGKVYHDDGKIFDIPSPVVALADESYICTIDGKAYLNNIFDIPSCLERLDDGSYLGYRFINERLCKDSGPGLNFDRILLQRRVIRKYDSGFFIGK
jgi:hypothetical protein